VFAEFRRGQPGVKGRLGEVRDRVEAARLRSEHAASSVEIVAVSKRHPPAAIADAYQDGVRTFGENYVQELVAKSTELSELESLSWHYIGQLQRNKVSKVVGVADLIHAADSERLLRAIDRHATERGITQSVLIAVSLAGEAQKSGVSVSELKPVVELAKTLPALECLGLMTMPPMAKNPEDNRGWFRQLRELRDSLATDEQPLADLSMGTSGDFDVAVEEGATLIRVGTAIFGERPSG